MITGCSGKKKYDLTVAHELNERHLMAKYDGYLVRKYIYPDSGVIDPDEK